MDSRAARPFHFLAAAIVTIGALCLAASTSAATITVNATCSLADAITASNTDTATGGCAAGSGADTISLSANITLSAALPQLTTGAIINGNSHTIDGGGGYRIFDIATAYNADANAAPQRVFTINNLTLRSGSSVAGGAIRVVGGRADNLASLTLNNCNVYSSSSSGHGGGIYAQNALVVIGPTSLMSGNSATSSGGDIWADDSTVKVIGSSTLTYGTAGAQGGSIYATDSTLTVQNAAITHSTAGSDGGGIAYVGGDQRTVTIANTVISNNSAGQKGGGLYANLHANATLAINNSTMFSNSATGGGADYRVEGNGTFTINGQAASG